MANDIQPWVYTADDGRNYITGLNGEVGAQMDAQATPEPKVGGRLATSADLFPPLPSSVVPRRAYCKNPAGKGRYVTIMEPTANLATTGNTVTLGDSDGATSVYTVRKVHGENFGRSRV